MIWPLAAAVAEGVLSRVGGAERDSNPYDDTNARERYGAWTWGWFYADKFLEINFDVAAWNYDEDEAA